MFTLQVKLKYKIYHKQKYFNSKCDTYLIVIYLVCNNKGIVYYMDTHNLVLMSMR